MSMPYVYLTVRDSDKYGRGSFDPPIIVLVDFRINCRTVFMRCK
jgi:hypothetical protein